MFSHRLEGRKFVKNLMSDSKILILLVWVFVICYLIFDTVCNFIFFPYIMSGTKSKLAAQWEIIPNKSSINSWWIHASSEKEEDELD